MIAGKYRPNWSETRDRVDLTAVVTALLGTPPGRRGERSSRRLWWNCPFHDDKNPSLCVTAGKRVWRCFGCGAHGDAMELVRRLNPGWSFRECVEWLAGQCGVVPTSTTSHRPSGGTPSRPRPPAAGRPGKAAERPAEPPSGLALTDALKLIGDAEATLWVPEGRPALEYLRGRGLSDETIKAARLGWTPEVWLPTREGDRYFRESGITIPWHENGRLTCVNIRRPEGSEPKYRQAFGDCRTLFPDPAVIRTGKPLVVCEGELDTLLVGQALGDVAAAVTLGSASSRPDPLTRRMMRAACVWFLAHDADDAGDRAASGWPARAIRVRPPIVIMPKSERNTKDWGDHHANGLNLRRWWTDRLGGTEAPELFTRDELSTWRWGDASE